MKTMLQVCVVALAVIGLSPSAFAGENHCYPSLTGDRSAGETNERGYKFHTAWAILTRAMLYRSMFGLSGERNEEVIQFLADSLGCRFESQTAHAMKRTMDVELIKIRERYLREVEKGEREEFLSGLGELVVAVPWPEDAGSISTILFEENEDFQVSLSAVVEFERANWAPAGNTEAGGGGDVSR